MSDWGSGELDLYYAGCHINIRGLSSNQWEILAGRYQALTHTKQKGFIEVKAQAVSGFIPEEDPNRYDRNGIYTPLLQYDAGRTLIAGQNFRASIEHAVVPYAQLLTTEEEHLSRSDVFENFLRVVAAYTSLQQGGLFMHSAGIIFDGHAWLFLGRSGAGKSTLSALALDSGEAIMSDDCNILRPRSQGGYEVAPVPFAGELGNHANYAGPARPLGGLFWLQQSPQLSLEPMGAGTQLARLLACCPVVNVDPHRLDSLTDTCTRLLHELPLQALNFWRDDLFTLVRQTIMESRRETA